LTSARPHLPRGGGAAAIFSILIPIAMTTPADPDDELDDFRDSELDLDFEELADFSDSYARSQEDGWFYPDDD
jgi:hypothetical protein